MRRFLWYFLIIFIHTATAQVSDYQTLFLDKKLTVNANAVFRLDEIHIDIVSQNKMTYKVKKVVTVLNKEGDRYANVHIFYDQEKKIKNPEARIYDALGHELERIRARDFNDISAVDGFSLYRDDRLLRYRYTPIQYPYTLELSYEVETSDTGVFPPWYFVPGYNTSVEKSRYSITYPSQNLKPVFKEHLLGQVKVEKKNSGERIFYSADTIPAIERESYAPYFQDVVPRLSVRLPQFHYKGFDAKVSDWNGLGAWIDRHLLQGRTALPEATKLHARALVSGVDDNLDKAKIIYRYMQDHTRYINVQIGIGGLRPISAIDVDRLKYGDCKGLSNYTKALLEAVGVTSFYTVVQAGKDKVDFEDDFSDLRQGNHVILAIPHNNKYYWIDCTSQVDPFGFVGDFTDDRKVLIVKPGGGEIVKTISYLNEENHQATVAEYSLSADGSISGSVDIATKGIRYDNRFYIMEYSEDDLIKHYKEYWSNINNIEIRDHNLINDREKVVFQERVFVSATKYASLSGDRILFPINAFNKNTSIPKRYRERVHPLEIQRGYHDEDQFTVQLPIGFMVEALPKQSEVETEFGHYRTEFVHDPEARTICYRRSLFIRKGIYPKEKYTPFRNFK